MDKALADKSLEDMLEALLVPGIDQWDTGQQDTDHRGTDHRGTVLASHVLMLVDMCLQLDEFQQDSDLHRHDGVRVYDPKAQTYYELHHIFNPTMTTATT